MNSFYISLPYSFSFYEYLRFAGKSLSIAAKICILKHEAKAQAANTAQLLYHLKPCTI